MDDSDELKKNEIILLVRAEQEATAKTIDFGLQADIAIELTKAMFSESKGVCAFHLHHTAIPGSMTLLLR